MDFNPKISFFEHARNATPAGLDSLSSALAKIKEGTYKNAVELIRSTTDKKERAEAKKKLPALTWSGTFSKRNANSLIEYSGIICQDVDGLEENALQDLKAKLSQCPYLYACFVSPSGNGLKILYRVNTTAEQHLEAWQAIGNYLHDYFEVHIDEACKDICRLCFFSYDSEIIINESSYVIDVDFMAQWRPWLL